MIKGFLSPLTSLVFVFKHPRILPYLLLPIFISALFFTCLGAVYSSYSDPLMTWVSAHPWLSYLSWLGFILQWLLFSVFVFLTYTTVGQLIACPFNDLLSRKILLLKSCDNLHEMSFWVSASKSLIEVLKITSIKLFLLIFCFFMPPLMFVFLFFFVGWDHFDYPWSHKTLGIRNKSKLLLEHRFQYLGFCASFFLLFSIPFMGILAMPLAVVGASLIVAEKGRKLKVS